MQLVAHGFLSWLAGPVALEHALLVSLSERPAAGLELARRFDRSIGFFWSATHQQIYKVLRRMEQDGWSPRVSSGSPEGRRSGSTPSPTPAGPCSPTGTPPPRRDLPSAARSR